MTGQPKSTQTLMTKKSGTKRTYRNHPALQRWVNPDDCRLWAYQQRHHEGLTHDSCIDLIEGIRASGQHFSVIARLINDGSEIKYEIIAGERRHFAVSWLRAHEDPRLQLLIELRQLSDEEAFQVADEENRNRLDLCDFERSRSYRRALDEIFGGNQSQMAVRLKITNSWLSRYLEIGALPDDVRASFGSDREIRISYVARLAPALRKSAGAAIRERAAALRVDQAERKDRGKAPMKGGDVVTALLRPPQQASLGNSQEILDAGNRVVARWTASKAGIKIELPGRVVIAPGDWATALQQFVHNILASGTCL